MREWQVPPTGHESTSDSAPRGIVDLTPKDLAVTEPARSPALRPGPRWRNRTTNPPAHAGRSSNELRATRVFDRALRRRASNPHGPSWCTNAGATPSIGRASASSATPLGSIGSAGGIRTRDHRRNAGLYQAELQRTFDDCRGVMVVPRMTGRTHSCERPTVGSIVAGPLLTRHGPSIASW